MEFHKSLYRTESTFVPKTFNDNGRLYTRGHIIRLDELSSVARFSSSTTEDSSSGRIMRPLVLRRPMSQKGSHRTI